MIYSAFRLMLIFSSNRIGSRWSRFSKLLGLSQNVGSRWIIAVETKKTLLAF